MTSLYLRNNEIPYSRELRIATFLGVSGNGPYLVGTNHIVVKCSEP